MRTTSQFYSFDDIMTIPDNIMAQLQLIFVEAICYCSKKDISVYYPPETLYVCCDNEELKIYKQSTLAFTLGMDAELKPTPRYIALFGEPSFVFLKTATGLLICCGICFNKSAVISGCSCLIFTNFCLFINIGKSSSPDSMSALGVVPK